MAETIRAQQTLDCRGILCPLPIIKLSKAIKTIQVGEVLEMLATDPGSVPDVKAFQAQTGHEILTSDQQGGVYRFLVKRTK
ncbi:MAG: sulfurtransferase TusA family protein [Candidatus Rokubacteria bacterium]|nr:sulfurtransferase TusA family protein [Candidatus Rokubacteria bacterium]MBI2544712.1 sulfurtransferase TusA family protein [Candidatus Rokubacteria bacterium]MBI2555482.1 sulfurtransferase TusA family protein [Candidatus Rokubacteria bacterium]